MNRKEIIAEVLRNNWPFKTLWEYDIENISEELNLILSSHDAPNYKCPECGFHNTIKCRICGYSPQNSDEPTP